MLNFSLFSFSYIIVQWWGEKPRLETTENRSKMPVSKSKTEIGAFQKPKSIWLVWFILVEIHSQSDELGGKTIRAFKSHPNNCNYTKAGNFDEGVAEEYVLEFFLTPIFVLSCWFLWRIKFVARITDLSDCSRCVTTSLSFTARWNL